MTATPRLSARPVRRALGGLLVAAVTACLPACGSATPGAAAVVGDRRISVSELQQATKQLQYYVGPSGEEVTQQQVLFLLITEPLAAAEAARNQVGISMDDAREEYRKRTGSLDVSAPALQALRASGAINSLQRLSGDQAEAALRKLSTELTSTKIQVNPRYGFFDTKKLSIADETPNWLVVKAESAPAATP